MRKADLFASLVVFLVALPLCVGGLPLPPVCPPSWGW
jgi:hypothetical protein